MEGLKKRELVEDKVDVNMGIDLIKKRMSLLEKRLAYLEEAMEIDELEKAFLISHTIRLIEGSFSESNQSKLKYQAKRVRELEENLGKAAKEMVEVKKTVEICKAACESIEKTKNNKRRK
jgi:hypothetical protein